MCSFLQQLLHTDVLIRDVYTLWLGSVSLSIFLYAIL